MVSGIPGTKQKIKPLILPWAKPSSSVRAKSGRFWAQSCSVLQAPVPLMGTESWHFLWDQCSELWALVPCITNAPARSFCSAMSCLCSCCFQCSVGQGEAGNEPGKVRIWSREACGHVRKKDKQVLHREVIRFRTGSEKIIRNNWNKTKQKKTI